MEFGEEESFDKPVSHPREDESDEYEYEYEDESEEDQGTAFALRHRPVFIPKVSFIRGCEEADQPEDRAGP